MFGLRAESEADGRYGMDRTGLSRRADFRGARNHLVRRIGAIEQSMQEVDLSVDLGGIRMKNPVAAISTATTYALLVYSLFTIRLENESKNEGKNRITG